MTVSLHGRFDFDLSEFEKVVSGKARVVISPHARRNVERSFKALCALLKKPLVRIYGVHTGFGALQTQNPLHWGAHQKRQVANHACGVGDPMEGREVRAMMYLRALTLSRGFSGIKPSTFEKYVALLNSDRLPRVPSEGSVGASGDLMPLAHAAWPVISQLPEKEIGPRDGLALINGTEACCALSLISALEGQRLLQRTFQTAALSLFAIGGKTEAWSQRLLRLKKHSSTYDASAKLLAWLDRYEAGGLPQDPYSFRAAAQVIGCAAQLSAQALSMLECEAASVTDNPSIFLDTALHGANFHGIYVGVAADQYAWALHLLMQASERRTDFLLSGSRGLPAMLSAGEGDSGLMETQVVQAALVADARILTQPASSGSMPTNGRQEDLVPMAMGAALKLKRVLLSYSRVLAIEAAAACRAIWLSKREQQLRRLTRLGPFFDAVAAEAQNMDAHRGARYSQSIEKLAELFRRGA